MTKPKFISLDKVSDQKKASNQFNLQVISENAPFIYKRQGRKLLIANILFINLIISSFIVWLIYCLITEKNAITYNQKSWDKDLQNLNPQALHYKTFVNDLLNKNCSVESAIKKFVSPPLSSHIEQEWSNENNSDKSYSKPFPILSQNQCIEIPLNLRFDCLPKLQASKERCEARGCCWKSITDDEIPSPKQFHSRLYPSHLKNEKKRNKTKLNIPYCFYPAPYSLYNITEIDYLSSRISGKVKNIAKSGYPGDIPVLSLLVLFETCSRVRIRITDYYTARWEPPVPAVPSSPGCHGEKLYQVDILQHTMEIVISRKDNAKPLFDMRMAAPLIYSQQFLQLSTILSSPYIYGLGQHLDGLLLDTYWHRLVLWNADQVPEPKKNLYGSHPFYMVMESDGSAHGVFLLNSNAMEVILQPTPALTFNTIGGILDFYVFLGPSPDEVISQYTEVVGRPFLPPYWSLGYHQCRYGYGTLEAMKKVWKRTREAGIPFDVQWNDIDYMDNRNDFTLSTKAYNGLPQFVGKLHQLGMHYVIILDPGISGGEKKGTYVPFDIGIKEDVFVKNFKGELFVGKVWNPNVTVFPDFTKPKAVDYWTFLISRFKDVLDFDGLWIDMNEPSNFFDGEKDGCPANSTLEHPPFLPQVIGGKLYHQTLCMTAKHYIGSHYNVHNIYGFSEVIATYAAFKMLNKDDQPFIISRSSFPGLGQFAGHWTGDVYSDWFNMWKSIGDVVTTNLLGIPMVGADICGFNGNTTVDLCSRWMQLGAFYPFSRNHNTDDAIDQDPVALGSLVVNSARKALLQRYTLLPFLYTLFSKAHSTGVPVAKPLFFKHPRDTETFAIDTQFMWGDELMIIPVLKEVSLSVKAYFPQGKWYDWYTGRPFTVKGQEYLTVPAQLDTIPLAVAGGSVLPCQVPASTTTESRRNPFGLVVALNEEEQASGELVWNRPRQPGYTKWKFRLSSQQLISSPLIVVPTSEEELTLGWITLFGISYRPTRVYLNYKKINFTYSGVSQVLKIEDLSVNFKEPFTVLYI